MKKLIPFAIISLSLAAGSHAAPFMAIGDGAELFLTGALSVRADDNIFLTQNETDDVIYEITPGADLTFGKNSMLQGALTANLAFTNYVDNGFLNTKLAGADFFTRYDDGKMKLAFNTGFHELNQNSPDISAAARAGHLTRRNIFSASGHAEVEVSQLLAAGAGVEFIHEDYRPAGFTDSDNLSVPLDLFYKVTPKVDLSVGYRYRDYEVDTGDDSIDHFFNIGARGDFSPKLTGRIVLGLNQRRIEGGDDDEQLGFDSSLAYEVTAKTSLQVGATNDFGTSPQGQQQKNFTLNAALTTKLNAQWTLNGGVSYRRIEYPSRVDAGVTVAGRTDDYWEGNLGINYIFDSNLTLVGAYVHRNYESPLAGADFSNNVFSIAANFRY